MWILAAILLVVAFPGTDGQQIVLDPLRLISPCSQGLRSDFDNFTLTGTIGRNISALVQSKWATLVCLVMAGSMPYDLDIAAKYVGITAQHCQRSATVCCTCDNINTGSTHFVVNVIVRQERSTGKIVLRWRHQNGTEVYNPSTSTLPVVYDVSRASLILTVNGVQAKQLSAPFGVYFVPNKDNTVQLCCMDTASPCYPRITINSQTIGSQSNCVHHTIFVPPVNYAANVTLSYSVCTKSDYITAGTGVIGVTPPATPISTFSSSKRGGKGWKKFFSTNDVSPEHWNIILIVILAVVPLLFAIGVGVYCLNARLGKPQVSNQRTNEITSKEFNSDDHQPDRQQPDDERKRSPSHITEDEISLGTLV